MVPEISLPLVPSLQYCTPFESAGIQANEVP
jgi:hypothetical protein